MTNLIDAVWQSNMPTQLAKTMTSIDDEQVMRDFLRDVMTEKEIIEIAARLEAARLLSRGETYKNVIKNTKLSSRTVARISDWLQSGRTGYSTVLVQMGSHQDHIPPARA
jgi:TrpR-related protein YerC/YecD